MRAQGKDRADGLWSPRKSTGHVLWRDILYVVPLLLEHSLEGWLQLSPLCAFLHFIFTTAMHGRGYLHVTDEQGSVRL